MDNEKIQIDDESGDRKYFSLIPHYILNHSSSTDQALYMQMKRFSGENGDCFASKRTLKAKLRIGHKSLDESINYLISRNWIFVRGEKLVETGGGVQKVTVYGVRDIWKENVDFYSSKGGSRIAPLDAKVVLEGEEGGSRIAPNKNYINKKATVSLNSLEKKPWILEDKLKEMEIVPGSTKDILATFIREKNLIIENSDQLSAVIGRHGRDAKILQAYPIDRIFSTIDRIKKDNDSRIRQNNLPFDWHLGTVLKYLTK